MSKQPALRRDGYAVFVRALSLGSATAADKYAHLIEVLDGFFFKHINGDAQSFFPNPNGGAIYLPNVEAALQASKELIRELADHNISVAIGVAWGRFERVSNVATWNCAAQPLNMAARLAFAKKAHGHVLVTPEVEHDALLANVSYQGIFGGPLVCKVKGQKYPCRRSARRRWRHYRSTVDERLGDFASVEARY